MKDMKEKEADKLDETINIIEDEEQKQQHQRVTVRPDLIDPTFVVSDNSDVEQVTTPMQNHVPYPHQAHRYPMDPSSDLSRTPPQHHNEQPIDTVIINEDEPVNGHSSPEPRFDSKTCKMVRVCIVEKCDSNDMKILCHRFPSKKTMAEKWLESLHLKGYDFEELHKYVVCTLHFDAKDYRNADSNFLNSTAVPRLSNVESRVTLFGEIVEEIATQFGIDEDANESNVNNEFVEEILQEDLPLKSSFSYSTYEYDILEDDDACIDSEENENEEEPESREVGFEYLSDSERSESFEFRSNNEAVLRCSLSGSRGGRGGPRRIYQLVEKRTHRKTKKFTNGNTSTGNKIEKFRNNTKQNPPEH